MALRRRRPPPLAAILSAALLSAAPGCKKGDESQTPAAEPGPEEAADDDEYGALEDPEESPYLDFSNFNDVVEGHQAEIVACYEETAGEDKDAPVGRVKTTFVIDGDGKVTSIQFDEQRSTLSHAGLNACIERVASAWTFNISLTGGDTTMPYTFDFEPGGLLP